MIARAPGSNSKSLATRTDDRCFLAIERLDNVLVGYISVAWANPRSGRFRHALAIGASYRRQGFGTEAVTLLLRFYFGELRYQKCDSGIWGFNDASLAMHEKLGFQIEGRVRRAIFSQGDYHDEIMVGITAEEFVERHPR